MSLKDKTLNISMLVPGMPFDGHTVKTKSLGGSESAGYYMGKALADRGHNITMFCNCDQSSQTDGVTYIPIGLWDQYAQTTPHDITIVQRAPSAFKTPLHSKLNVLWCHDLALKRAEAEFKGSAWNIDTVFVLSDFMRDQYISVYGDMIADMLFKTRNGLDLDLFEGITAERPNKKQIVYTARPERGLDNLVNVIMPKILALDPEITLHIAAYDNPVDSMNEFYNAVYRACAMYGDRIVNHGSLTKEQLRDLYAESQAYVYPLPSPTQKNFDEVSCITAMECQASGLPIIASKRGALVETIDIHAGILIDGEPWSDEYAEEFAKQVVNLINDDTRREEMASVGIAHASTLSWGDVAEQWENHFYKLFSELNDNPETLATYFLKNSDIMACRELMKRNSIDSINHELKKHYSFIDTPADYADHYDIHESNSVSKNSAINLEIGPSAVVDRANAIIQMMKGAKNPKVLEYGCAHGHIMAYLQSQLGGDYTGIEISQDVIDFGKEYVDKWAPEPGNIRFIQGTHDAAEIDDTGFDFLIMAEVLEHVPNPQEVIDTLEKYLKPGGKVIITTPTGPWEYEGYHKNEGREHIWHFEPHDWKDILINKEDMTITHQSCGLGEMSNKPLGHNIVLYTANGKPCESIDWDRKLLVQRPDQTLSVIIMAGEGAEKTLDWMLDSVQYIADEIIIADTGMNSLAFGIADNYNVKIVSAPDPKVAGFETPRNIGLDNATKDWVLWIDTDERLLDPIKLKKYLRKNIFNGYSIRQHHFSVDANFPPDMPVRLFRNNIGMRFYGMIHEHPELELNEGPGATVVLADANIAHVGYLTETVRKGRFNRNYPLLQKDIETYPDRILQKYFIMRDNMLLCNYELQMNGGRITPDIETRCRETIELCRTHFLGKGVYCHIDALKFYSDALTLLGEGIDVGFEIVADKSEAHSNGGSRYRFANREDFMTEFNNRADIEFSQFETEYI